MSRERVRAKLTVLIDSCAMSLVLSTLWTLWYAARKTRQTKNGAPIHFLIHAYAFRYCALLLNELMLYGLILLENLRTEKKLSVNNTRGSHFGISVMVYYSCTRDQNFFSSD